jgi:hypothetical protein
MYGHLLFLTSALVKPFIDATTVFSSPSVLRFPPWYRGDWLVKQYQGYPCLKALVLWHSVWVLHRIHDHLIIDRSMMVARLMSMNIISTADSEKGAHLPPKRVLICPHCHPRYNTRKNWLIPSVVATHLHCHLSFATGRGRFSQAVITNPKTAQQIYASRPRVECHLVARGSTRPDCTVIPRLHWHVALAFRN